MTSGFVLSIAAALVLGSYLVGVKRYFSHYPPTLLVALTYSVAVAWYLPAVALAVPVDQLVFWVGLRGGAVLVGTAGFTALALFAFYRSLALGDVSYVAPISKIVPVFVLPLEVLLLGQQLSVLQVGGVCVATVAVYVANYQNDSLLAPVRQLVRSKAGLFALASAAAFGVVDVGKRISMQEIGVSPEGFVVTMLVLVTLFLAPSAVRNRRTVDWWGDRYLLVVAGLVLVVGQHLVAVAFQTLPASVVSPVVNTQGVVAVFLGSVLLGEPHVRVRLTAAGLAVVGIVLISVG
ncbi:DMT family transporter [Halovenus sp. HT40]|uniref:DMT family transporter n=1 Tax=Halovenus sp. HT40 TaxID=3126691 RepID=UPI00300F53A5